MSCWLLANRRCPSVALNSTAIAAASPLVSATSLPTWSSSLLPRFRPGINIHWPLPGKPPSFSTLVFSRSLFARWRPTPSLLRRTSAAAVTHDSCVTSQTSSASTSTLSRLPSKTDLKSSATAYSTTTNMNGDGVVKRKRNSISATAERPVKHLKPENSTLTPGDSTPANGTVYDVQDEEDLGPLMAVGPTQADSPEWQATIEEVVKSVVSIHFCQTCSFDTELSMSSQATGFVVDAERGYILTNRHVVCPGPFWGYVIFDNHEEVSWLSW